jgi:voltage-gated potassium channel Kch
MTKAIKVGTKPETDGADIDGGKTDTLESQISISIFLGILVLTVFVMPSVGVGEVHTEWYSNLVFTALFVSGISITWRRRRLLIFSSLLGLIAFSMRWIAWWRPTRFWELGDEISTLLVVLIVEYILVFQIFRRAGPITAASIQAAVAIYLLFGMMWANAYLMAMQLDPHSFQSAVGLSSSSVSEWYYYSYVTLTTLGYGDIIPISRIARALAVGEALTGQLYLAVLIARLIGMEIISSQERKTRNSR